MKYFVTLKYKRSLLNALGNHSFKCPFEICSEVISSNKLLAHLHKKHFESGKIYWKEIRQTEFVQIEHVALNRSYIPQLLLYGGKVKCPDSMPGKTLLTKPNAYLPRVIKGFRNFMPIVLCMRKMYRQTPYFPPGRLSLQRVIWLVGAVASEPVWATVCLRKQHETADWSHKMRVLSYTDTRNPINLNNDECISLSQEQMNFWKWPGGKLNFWLHISD